MILHFQQDQPCPRRPAIHRASTTKTTYAHAYDVDRHSLHYFRIQSRRPGVAGFNLELNHAEARELANELLSALTQAEGKIRCTPRLLPPTARKKSPRPSKRSPTA